MDKDERIKLIRHIAEQIRQELNPNNKIVSLLYGEPIDMNNPDEILVAAVFKEMQNRLKYLMI